MIKIGITIWLLFVSKINCQTETTEDEYELDVQKNVGWVVFASILLIALFVASSFLYKVLPFTKNKTWIKDNCGVFSCAIYLGICGFIFLLIFWLGLYPEIIKYHTWLETTFRVDSLEENPYECCDIVNCQCTEFSGTSCSTLVNNLQEGTCGNGYDCCHTEYYDCNCREVCSYSGGSNGYSGSSGSSGRGTRTCRTECDTCSRCTRSVSNERCEVVCGTCYSPVVTFSYLTYREERYSISETESCGRDDYSCVTDFFSEFGDENDIFSGYYNPNNFDEWDYTNDISSLALGFTIFFAVLVIIGILPVLFTIMASMVICLKNYTEERRQRVHDPEESIEFDEISSSSSS